MHEDLLDLGDDRFGLLTRPPAACRATAVVLLNAGQLHRTGAFRLNVHLARAVAAAGYPALRWDAPGIGDAIAPARQAPAELARTVIDRLQAATGCQAVVVGGLCSGADLAWQTGLADRRVRGLLLLDGLARGGLWYRYGQLRLLLRRPLAAVARRLLRWPRRAGGGIAAAAYRDWPPRGSECAELAALLQRDVHLFALYTGGAADYMTHRRQFGATFGALGRDRRIQLQHWTECDHLFFDPDDRDRLNAAVVAWLRHAFASPADA